MTRFLISIFLIPIGIFSGIFIQHLLKKGNIYKKYDTTVRRGLQRIALLVLNPLAILGAIWALPLQDLEIVFLPLFEIAAILLAGLISAVYTKIKKIPQERRGSHFCVCYYSNIGSVGGLITYALLGESGFIIATFYKMFEEFMYYGVGFPLASRFAKDEDGSIKGFLGILKDPFVIIPMIAVTCGLILNLSPPVRPAFYTVVNSLLVPSASFLLLTSIGMAMHFEKMVKNIQSSFSTLIIKYMVMPVIITGMAWLCGMGMIQNGIPLKTIFILCFMPSGFVAVILPGLYNLDIDYANTAWTMTMLFLIPGVPFLYFGLQHILPVLIRMSPPF